MKLYTKKGDDGTTGLFYGGRVRKDETGPEAYGTVDEAVTALGVARAAATAARRSDLAEEILRHQRSLFVVAAELATGVDNRSKLAPGVSLVTAEMVAELEPAIDRVVDEVGMPAEFVVPGGDPVAAAIDVARTTVRRAERRAVSHAASGNLPGSHVIPFLNRLADYLYMLARAAEGEWTPSRPDKDKDKE